MNQPTGLSRKHGEDTGVGKLSGSVGGRAFRFFDNREKYLMFVTTCSAKTAVAGRVGREIEEIEPSGSALRVFDAGVGDGTVLSHVLRDLHRRFPHVPWLMVGKEVSMEDVRLTLETDSVVAESRVDARLLHPKALSVVAFAVASAARHAQLPLHVLATDTLVAHAYGEAFLHPSVLP